MFRVDGHEVPVGVPLKQLDVVKGRIVKGQEVVIEFPRLVDLRCLVPGQRAVGEEQPLDLVRDPRVVVPRERRTAPATTWAGAVVAETRTVVVGTDNGERGGDLVRHGGQPVRAHGGLVPPPADVREGLEAAGDGVVEHEPGLGPQGPPVARRPASLEGDDGGLEEDVGAVPGVEESAAADLALVVLDQPRGRLEHEPAVLGRAYPQPRRRPVDARLEVVVLHVLELEHVVLCVRLRLGVPSVQPRRYVGDPAVDTVGLATERCEVVFEVEDPVDLGLERPVEVDVVGRRFAFNILVCEERHSCVAGGRHFKLTSTRNM